MQTLSISAQILDLFKWKYQVQFEVIDGISLYRKPWPVEIKKQFPSKYQAKSVHISTMAVKSGTSCCWQNPAAAALRSASPRPSRAQSRAYSHQTLSRLYIRSQISSADGWQRSLQQIEQIKPQIQQRKPKKNWVKKIPFFLADFSDQNLFMSADAALETAALTISPRTSKTLNALKLQFRKPNLSEKSTHLQVKQPKQNQIRSMRSSREWTALTLSCLSSVKSGGGR